MKNKVLPRLALLVLAAACVLSGLDAALLRLGTGAPVAGTLTARLAALHGPLMEVGFLGTLISLERAVAARARWALAAPALSAGGCLALVAGAPQVLGQGMVLVSGLVLLTVYACVYRRAVSVALDVESLGAVALVLGNLTWLAGHDVVAAVPLWLLFPVLTVVGERLELARVAFLDPVVEAVVRALAVIALLGACALPVTGTGRLASGPALLGLGVVMAWYDVARRTVRATGGVRLAAACMMAGYLWLAVGGLAWTLTAWTQGSGAAYEIIIHALSLGFAFSMVLAHAPTILPALLHRQLPYRRIMWLPLVLLHLSLVVRVAGLVSEQVRAWQAGGIMGVLAVLVFLVTSALIALRAGPLGVGSSSQGGGATAGRVTLSPLQAARGRRGHRRREQVRRNGVVLAWVIVAGVLAVLILAGPLAAWGQWIALHTLLLGGIGSAITVWSAHFADTLLHRPALGGAALVDLRLAVHGLGTLAVLVGITSHHQVLAMAGMSLVTAAALAGAVAIAVQYHRAVAPRLAGLAVHYALALILLAIGAVLGYLTSWAAERGWARLSDVFYLAHTTTMLLGFVGTTVLGTLTVLWPTMLRTKMEPCAPTWTSRGLPALVGGTVMVACSGLWQPAAGLGTLVYLAGAGGVLVPAWRTARRVPPTSFSTASSAAAVAWFLGCVVWMGLGVTTAPNLDQAREVIHLLRVPLAAGFALQVLGAALSYLTPVMLGGGPATTRLTNRVMDRAAAYRVTATNAGLALAVATPLPWTVRMAGALLAGAVAAYVVVGMGLSARELVRRTRRGDDDVVATSLTVGPPALAPGAAHLPVGALSPREKEPRRA
ncbi:hypothetical protein [Actinomyces urogenitalis]|uniref:hypothetical protein n=1 Tax=Actinomyces urogenitalis TaxID=103621 RepID=UPI00189706B2|nr:hypothetical protein [Actinomyces urogenitalis]MDU0865210.1 hypothetical protein [Actinomyces urogenitalis]MDU0874810.1 hypothetical protein [Actinomyces urogenitalis]MDU1564772.1 hypothetical protein [Actinomyces urogenitalis]MDU1639992.1 hypothetical protein [Actinomyces urogenitalis]MDU5427093.1 hypothetical protein [Actinomyces urogenitalis]